MKAVMKIDKKFSEMKPDELSNQMSRKAAQRLVLFFVMACIFISYIPNAIAAVGGAAVAAEPPQRVYGRHNETVEDMRVKVMGGHVRVTRTWDQDRWVINKRWAPLSVLKCNEYSDTICNIYRGRIIYTHDADFLTFTNFWSPLETIKKTTTGFLWEDREGNWIEYGGEAFDYKAIAYGDRNNVRVQFQYSNDQLVGVFDHFGNQILWFNYGSDDILDSIRDYANRRVVYDVEDTVNTAVGSGFLGSVFTTGFIMSGILNTVTDVRNKNWNYTYVSDSDSDWADSAWVGARTSDMLRTKTDPDGRVQSLVYNSIGGVDTIIDDNFVELTMKNEPNNSTGEFYKQIKTPEGKITEQWYEKEGDLFRRDVNGATEWKRTKSGRTWTITDHAGQRTVQTVDEWENITKVIHPDGKFTTSSYSPKHSNVLEYKDENGVITKNEYDSNGFLFKKTEAFGLPEQRVITYVPDPYGNVASTRYLADAVSPLVSTNATYDDYGNMVTYTDGEGHVWRYTHDVMGNVLTVTEPVSTKTWTYTYDDAGNQTSMKDPLDHLTTYEYDGRGNRTKVIDAKLHNMVYTYNLKNRLTEITDHLGNKVVLDYDLDGRLIKTTDQSNKVTTNTYYADGKPFTITDGSNNTITFKYNKETINGAGKVSSIEYPTFTRVFAYDVRGRVISQTDVLSPTKQLITVFDYDAVGNRTLVTDPKLRNTVYAFDGLNRISKMTDALIQDTLYGYDNRGNLRTVTDPNSNATTYVFDGNNRLLSESRPMGQVYAYTYNAAGRLATRIDSKDQKAEYLYDDAGRNTTINHYATSASTTPLKTVTLNYDEFDLLSDYSDGTSSASYTYDELNRKTLETVNLGGFAKSFGYGYYKNGRKKTYTDPDGTTHTFSYNASNQLSAIQIPGAGAITINSFEWLMPKAVTFPGGTTTNVNYDGLLRVKDFSVKDPASNPVMSYGYTLDDAGNITDQQTEHGAYQFGYDELDRLETADNPNLQDETYTYDAVGNRLTDNNMPGTWGYNNNNQLTGIGAVTTFTFDGNGSTTSKTEGGTTTGYVYNLENRLSEVKQGTSTLATYYYDPFGRRLSKTVGGVSTYFMYADEGLIAEFDAVGAPIRQYGYQPDSTWGTDPTYLKTGGQYYYYQNDHLGTPKKLIAANGQVVWSAEYLAFGDLPVAAGGSIENPLRFAGQYYDGEVGLQYNYYRYYDPSLGRYSASDPVGLIPGHTRPTHSSQLSEQFAELPVQNILQKEGINQLYSYVGNNSVNNIDPTGEYLPLSFAIWTECYLTCIGNSVTRVMCGIGDESVYVACAVTCLIRSLNPLRIIRRVRDAVRRIGRGR